MKHKRLPTPTCGKKSNRKRQAGDIRKSFCCGRRNSLGQADTKDSIVMDESLWNNDKSLQSLTPPVGLSC